MENTPNPDIPLTEEQLAQVRNSHSMLSTDLLQKAYMEAFERCRLDRRGQPPQTVHIQVLVQVWRVLRKHSSAKGIMRWFSHCSFDRREVSCPTGFRLGARRSISANRVLETGKIATSCCKRAR
jgi:hypothetical protein